MNNNPVGKNKSNSISRRKFFKLGSAVLASGAMSVACNKNSNEKYIEDNPESKIIQFRTLGRTGFKVSDISMGGTRATDSNVYRYAYDHGVNYFDVAEGYFNGGAERRLGEALKYMERKKVFITTKLGIDHDDDAESLIQRFRKCQERMKTDYVDCLYMHGIEHVSILNHEGFFKAIKQLKAEGRLRYAGLSSHGPEDSDADSMEKVLLAAVEDGRFDVMLMVYNFMNKEAGKKILAACKEKNIGTTAMKTTPGVLELDEFDPENLNEDQSRDIRELQEEDDLSREEAIEVIREWHEEDKENVKASRLFVEKYNIKTEDQLYLTSLKWILQDPDMHTACISFNSYDLVDKMIPLSGSNLSRVDKKFLQDYEFAYNRKYCRHGCDNCLSACPQNLPVNSIMRYNYYYSWHKMEKNAISKYARLGNKNATACFGCHAPCSEACPYKLNVKKNMLKVHSRLSLV
jgi:predicted aldo/keto reductase-like oxidoreductase